MGELPESLNRARASAFAAAGSDEMRAPRRTPGPYRNGYRPGAELPAWEAPQTRPRPRQGDYARERQYALTGARDRLWHGDDLPERLSGAGELLFEQTGIPALGNHFRARAHGDTQSAATEGGVGLLQALGAASMVPGRGMFGRRAPAAPAMRNVTPAAEAASEASTPVPLATRPQTRASDGSILPRREPQPFRRTAANSGDLASAAIRAPRRTVVDTPRGQIIANPSQADMMRLLSRDSGGVRNPASGLRYVQDDEGNLFVARNYDFTHDDIVSAVQDRGYAVRGYDPHMGDRYSHGSTTRTGQISRAGDRLEGIPERRTAATSEDLASAARGGDDIEGAWLRHLDETGFDMQRPYYHGTNSTFDNFNTDNVHMTTNQREAMRYAQMRARERGGSARVMRVYPRNPQRGAPDTPSHHYWAPRGDVEFDAPAPGWRP